MPIYFFRKDDWGLQKNIYMLCHAAPLVAQKCTSIILRLLVYFNLCNSMKCILVALDVSSYIMYWHQYNVNLEGFVISKYRIQLRKFVIAYNFNLLPYTCLLFIFWKFGFINKPMIMPNKKFHHQNFFIEKYPLTLIKYCMLSFEVFYITFESEFTNENIIHPQAQKLIQILYFCTFENNFILILFFCFRSNLFSFFFNQT